MSNSQFDQEIMPYLDQLSKEELEELFAAVSDYDESPVGIEEFIDSDRYLGGYFQGQVFPYWRSFFKDVYPSPFYSPYWLVALRGSIGAGKSTIACAGMVYDLHRLLCMANPQGAYGLIPSTRILFAIFNVTLSLTQDVVWDKITQMMASSPYFSRLTALLQARKKRGDSMFPKNIDFFMGSRVGHTLGKAVFSAMLDEANFEVVEGQVYETFNSLLRRMESRFTIPGQGIPGKIWIVSSETDKFSTINKVVDSYRGKKGVAVAQPALWDVQPGRYAGPKFWVYKGSEARQPEVLKGGATNPLLTKEPEACIQVPQEHYDAFEADINASLRDLAGVATVSNYKLFRLRDRLTKSASLSSLFPDTFELDFDDDADQVINYVTAPNYFANPLNSHVPRFVHVDIALSGDRLGIASTYIINFKERKFRDINTMEEVTESIPEFVTEWAFGIEPKPGKQIPLFKVRAFLLHLQKVGYPIGGVSFDGFQSSDSIQLLSRAGIEATLVSVDKTSVPYMSFRSAVYEGRANIPKNAILMRELGDLEVSTDGKKVDHPEKASDGKSKGSKDISDAVCGSYFNADVNASKSKLFLMAEFQSQQVIHSGVNIKERFWPSGS